MDEARQAYERRRLHALGRVSVLDWALQERRESTPETAWMFCGCDFDTAALPAPLLHGLRSAVMQSGLRVNLLTYRDFDGLPAGVHVCSAEQFLAARTFRACVRRGIQVQILADILRISAAFQHGGWVVDCDTVWLRRAPALDVQNVDNLGHFFASMDADASVRGRTASEDAVHWELHYLKQPQDRLHLATPFAFPAQSPVAGAWLRWAAAVLRAATPVPDNNCGMSRMRLLVTAWGLEAAIAPSSTCSPIPPHLSPRCVLRKNTHLFDKSRVAEAMCVNNFCQASRLPLLHYVVAHPATAKL